MNWGDYRQRLGIGFSDTEKQGYFANRMINTLMSLPRVIDIALDTKEYIKFCNTIGVIAKQVSSEYRWEEAIQYISFDRKNPLEFLFSCIAFANCFSIKSQRECIIRKIEENLAESCIKYEIIYDSDGTFIFPKGAAELDEALVSEPLEWLSAYPSSRTAFSKALKQYADASAMNASDVADSFRKALECFFQEFFGGGKSLENYKSDYGKYLRESGIPPEISNGFEKLLNLYTDFMNNYAKHHDRTGLNVLEYIMYQTGNTIRLLISLKNRRKE